MTKELSTPSACLLHFIAREILDNPALRAVWLDEAERRVSFALQAGTETGATRERMRTLLEEHAAPGEERRRAASPDGGKSWPGACLKCPRSGAYQLPRGVRMVAMPSGLMLEQESCATSARFWRWEQVTWKRSRLSLWPRAKPAPAQPKAAHSHEHDTAHEWRLGLWLTGLCGLLAVLGMLLDRAGLLLPWGLAAYIAAYVAGAWQPVEGAWETIRRGRLDVHFLMLAVAVGAAVIGHWWEGAFLLFLFSGSGALEALAAERTERELSSLFHDAPKRATRVMDDGTESEVPVEDLRPGMKIRVRPGSQFPADAEVLTGTSAADEASLTGESLPVDKASGHAVYSGTMNLWGSLDCQVLRAAAESSLAKIIRLIEEARESKAPAQRFTDVFGGVYTYVILASTLAAFLVWWLVLGIPAFEDSGAGRSALYRAMTLLVVASPCALVLSIPSAILAGIAAAARRGILFRGGAAVERLAEVKRVALDKTGTLTTGELHIEGMETVPPGRETELLRAASALSHHSTHPVSRAIALYAREQQSGEIARAAEFRSLTGLGLEGRLPDGREVRLGRRDLFTGGEGTGGESWTRALPEPPVGVTETLVECGDLRGRILLRDTVRKESAELLRRLHNLGLKVTMLTGDRPEAAARVASELGLREYRAGLKPEDKVRAIQEWEAAGERVAMVGDGVNDAPSLAAAHVAVGMGLRGSDAVLEQADVVLMKDRLENFLSAYLLSTKAHAIIRQNLAVSLGVIAVLVLGALSSRLPLSLGVLGHEGSTVIVVANSLRLLFFRGPGV